YSTLYDASKPGNDKIISLLIEKGLNINEQNELGNTPLFTAIYWAINFKKENSVETVKFLISKGADVNIKNKMGSSVLMEVCQAAYINPLPERLELIKILLEAGAADTSCKSSWHNYTFFDYAKKNSDIAQVLEEFEMRQ